MKWLLTTVALLAVGLAGCADDGPEAPEPMEDGRISTQPSSTLWLSADQQLLDGEPAPAVVPLGWSWAEWFQGEMAPAWTSEPFENATRMDALAVTVTYEAITPLVFPDALRPQLTIWVGPVGGDMPGGDVPAFIDHGFQPGPLAWQPGQQETANFEVRLPVGGLVLDAGQQLAVYVGSYYPDGALVEGMGVVAGLSRVDYFSADTRDVPDGETETLAFDGTLVGGRCVAPLNVENSAHAMFPFEVDAGVEAIDVLLTPPSSLGLGPDMDMFLTDADGEIVAYAAGSAAPERIQIRNANLEVAAPGTWTFNVYNCQPQISSWTASLDITRA